MAGPTAVVDVIKDVDTQIAVSKRGLASGQHAGVRWHLHVPLVLPLAILPVPQDREIHEQNKLRLITCGSPPDLRGRNRLLSCMVGEECLGWVVNGWGSKWMRSASVKGEVCE